MVWKACNWVYDAQQNRTAYWCVRGVSHSTDVATVTSRPLKLVEILEPSLKSERGVGGVGGGGEGEGGVAQNKHVSVLRVVGATRVPIQVGRTGVNAASVGCACGLLNPNPKP